MEDENVEFNIRATLYLIFLLIVIILVYIIDKTKLALLICPIAVGCVSAYMEYKGKIKLNTALI